MPKPALTLRSLLPPLPRICQGWLRFCSSFGTTGGTLTHRQKCGLFLTVIYAIEPEIPGMPDFVVQIALAVNPPADRLGNQFPGRTVMSVTSSSDFASRIQRRFHSISSQATRNAPKCMTAVVISYTRY
jgi:hypothetical protein